jgi:lipoic acid synthetase
VITSVDRDDLDDQGASFWAETIRQVKALNPSIKIETLIPDFRGNTVLSRLVVDASPDVISHNLETVERITPLIRSASTYRRSLEVVRHIANEGKRAKSGIMLGLGETPEEVLQTMDDLLDSGCSIMTIGQYLAPTRQHLPVTEYIHPDIFEEYRKTGLKKGFQFVESSPLVRSSYHAEIHAE